MNDRSTEYLFLDYFMMTDAIRTETGCPVEDLTAQLLPGFWVSRSSISLTADDDRYYTGPFSVYQSLDEENKILTFLDRDGVEQQMDYGM